MKWRGKELTTRNTHITTRDRLILERFRKLGTPMSSHFCEECALSTSFLVGAAMSCMQRLEAPSSNVLRMLMKICATTSSRLTREQPPSYIGTTPRSALYFTSRTINATTLASSTAVDVPSAVRSIAFLRDRRDRKVLWSGSTSGNHVRKISTCPYFKSLQSLVILSRSAMLYAGTFGVPTECCVSLFVGEVDRRRLDTLFSVSISMS